MILCFSCPLATIHKISEETKKQHCRTRSLPSFSLVLVKPQAGDGRAKRADAADLSELSPDRWLRDDRGATSRRSRERETEEATDRRTDQTSSHFPKNLYIPFRLQLRHQEGSDRERGRGNRCSSNGEEDRLGAPFVSSGTKCDLCQGALALSSEMRACNLHGRHRGA